MRLTNSFDGRRSLHSHTTNDKAPLAVRRSSHFMTENTEKTRAKPFTIADEDDKNTSKLPLFPKG